MSVRLLVVKRSCVEEEEYFSEKKVQNTCSCRIGTSTPVLAIVQRYVVNNALKVGRCIDCGNKLSPFKTHG